MLLRLDVALVAFPVAAALLTMGLPLAVRDASGVVLDTSPSGAMIMKGCGVVKGFWRDSAINPS
jgi:hypothetical protein